MRSVVLVAPSLFAFSTAFSLEQRRCHVGTIGSRIRPVRFASSTAAGLGDFADQSQIEDAVVTPAPPVPSNKQRTTHSATTTPPKRPPFPIILWRFSRPHTLIGSALAIPALHVLAAPSLSQALPTLPTAFYAMLPALLMNIYITGLNQVTDVDIDRVNKPYLPIVAGLLTQRQASWIVGTCLLLSLLLGHVGPYATPGLAFALWGSALLGTAYSLPPLRLKRFPSLAAFCIVAVRGTVINAGFFAHAQAAAYQGASSVIQALTNPKCCISSAYFCIFGMVIALMKDVPDVSGDAQSQIRTFSVRLGQAQIFHAARRLLMTLFWFVSVGFGAGAFQARSVPPTALMRSTVSLAAVIAGRSVRRQSQSVNPNDSAQVYHYYMHLWKLFYLSYLALPLAR